MRFSMPSGAGLPRETLKEFRIGFAPNAKDALKTALLKKGFTEAQLLEAGLSSSPMTGGRLTIASATGSPSPFSTPSRASSPSAPARSIPTPSRNI